MKQVIFCADDYAIHPYADEAIISLIVQGRLTATSCLVLSPRWKQAAALLSTTIQNKADLGLHLDFTEFESTLKQSLPKLIVNSLLHQLPTEKLRAVISLQLSQFEDVLGRAPDYIDGHQHVHQLPQIRDVLLECLNQRYSTCPPWIRISRPPAKDGLKANIIGLLGGSSLKKKSHTLGLHHSHRLLGVYGFDQSRPAYQSRCQDWLAEAKSGDAFMCHPATSGWAEDPVGEARRMEFEFLSSKEFGQILQENQVIPSRGSITLD